MYSSIVTQNQLDQNSIHVYVCLLPLKYNLVTGAVLDEFCCHARF